MQHTAPRHNAIRFAIRHMGKAALMLGIALAPLTGVQAKTASTRMHVSAIVLPFCQMNTSGQTASVSVRCTAEQNYTIATVRGAASPTTSGGMNYAGTATVQLPASANGIQTVVINY